MERTCLKRGTRNKFVLFEIGLELENSVHKPGQLLFAEPPACNNHYGCSVLEANLYK